MIDKKYGVIEGFYGIPWTFYERKSMIDFLSKIGMSEYIYAPKDDPYHNVKWRDKYPDDKLAELKELSDFAKDKNVDFIWAIHPGQNLIKFDDYENEIKRVFDKYDQLNEVGINSFALCMDDIDRDIAYIDKKKHLKLVEDILSHIKNYENHNLLFVHPRYNEAWIDDKGYKYYEQFRNLDNLYIMWTGRDVVVPLIHSSNEAFKDLSGQNPNIRFNRPVNDYKRAEIFMEIFEYYDSEDLNFDSFFINPMNQAELSKLSIYQIGKYLKDPTNYDAIKSFKEGLLYLDEKVADDLFIISDSFYGSGVYERQKDKKFLEEDKINKAYEKGNTNEAIDLIDQKINALDNYFDNYTNEDLYKEVEPFFSSLLCLLKAVRKALKGNKIDAAMFYDRSKEYTVTIFKEFTLDEKVEREVITSRTLDKIYNELMNS